MSTALYLRAWDAWAPGLPDSESWRLWLQGQISRPEQPALPSCSAVPPLVRRRCGPLTRMVLEVAYRILATHEIDGGELNVVYSSRHGEWQTLQTMLRGLAAGEPPSPTLFGNSVHHTPCGIFSILAGQRGITRAISAGPNSLRAGLLEAYLLSRTRTDQPVLLICADLELEPPFSDHCSVPSFGYAFAFLLDGKPLPGALRLELDFASDWRSPQLTLPEQDPLLQFARQIIANKNCLYFPEPLDQTPKPCEPQFDLSALAELPDQDPLFSMEDLLPHRPPMILLHRWIGGDQTQSECEVLIDEHAPLLQSLGVPVLAGIEYMAQTIGAHGGHLALKKGLPIEVGFLLGSPKLINHKALSYFPLGTRLRVQVRHIWGEDSLMRFSCTIRDANSGDLLQSAELNTYKPQNLQEYLHHQTQKKA